ncbi:MAG: hypothetical protein KDD69_14970, partial [Bdellovibrionales bacterium]|nr:hypothetical protein [Bdellovibrionales bacterium]
RPDRSVLTITPSSVKKKMKDKAFAKGVNREDIKEGAAELDTELEQHIANVIAGMQEAAGLLGLEGEGR